MSLKDIFQDKRIIGFAGQKNTGKTNNLVYLIKQFRETNTETPIYVYGLPFSVVKYLKKYNVYEISTLKQLVFKKDCILIIDEFQKLKLNDRRYKEQLNLLIDFIHHNNIYLILSSPNIREFNSVIGGVIEQWILKTISLDDCINGSQIKEIVNSYQGRYKRLNTIITQPNEFILINDNYEQVFKCDYVSRADTKKHNKPIF